MTLDPASGGPFSSLRVTVVDGVAVAEIDNPPVNILTPDLYRDLRSLPDHAIDAGARVLVLRSANPDFFIAHYDVEQILSFPVDDGPVRDTELRGFHKLCERYRTLPIPTICEIAGRVGGGGGELAASCDMRFGTPSTQLCQMEVPLGILPGGTGTQRLPRLLGRGRAMEIVLGGDDIDGETLERWGWLNRALAADQLQTFVDGLAARIAKFPPEAVSRAKASVLAAGPDPTEGLLNEAFLFQETLRFPEAAERMQRFLDVGGPNRDGRAPGRGGRRRAGVVDRPEFLQRIKSACARQHDVYQHIRQIHQNPLGIPLPFHAQWCDTGFFGLDVHGVRKGFDMSAGGAGGDDHVVSDGGFPRYVDGGDVSRLGIVQSVENHLQQLVDGRGLRSVQRRLSGLVQKAITSLRTDSMISL